MDTQDLPAFGPLEEDLSVDVCIVGAGIAGLTTAYQLSREGKTVVVLDDGPIVSGETERTTAHLASALDDRFSELERMHGQQGAKLAAQSHSAAIDFIEATAREHRIDCDFARVDGYLFVPPGESTGVLDAEIEAARRAGLQVDWVDRVPFPSFDTGRALRFANQGQFHPLRYLAALTGVVQGQGGRIFAQTHAAKIEDGVPARVRTSQGKVITAKDVVVATNTPVHDRVAIHTKQAAYRTYVIAARVPSGSLPQALYWDTADPYHYVRLQTIQNASGQSYDLVIAGGEDHRTGQGGSDPERFERLQAWTRERIPYESIDYRWSGQIMEPADSLPFIGRNPGDRHTYVATGDSGNGITAGTLAGILLTDLILERENPWKDLYSPSRKPVHGLGEYVRDNINIARQYTKVVAPRPASGEVILTPDSGQVVRRGIKPVAVYCDHGGTEHEFSAVCPHLGCIVNWNEIEHSWDCPCHGSRFAQGGEVVNGPANKGLSPVKGASRAR